MPFSPLEILFFFFKSIKLIFRITRIPVFKGIMLHKEAQWHTPSLKWIQIVLKTILLKNYHTWAVCPPWNSRDPFTYSYSSNTHACECYLCLRTGIQKFDLLPNNLKNLQSSRGEAQEHNYKQCDRAMIETDGNGCPNPIVIPPTPPQPC